VPATLMMLQGFLQNQGDAWRWTLDHLHRSVDEFRVTADDQERSAELLHGYDAFAGTIGMRLAQLHQALAMPSHDPAFAPEIAGQSQASNWADGARAQLDHAFALLDALDDGDSASADAQRVHALRPDVDALLGSLSLAAPGTTLMPDERTDAYLESFREHAGECFLAAYRKVLSEAPQPWVGAAAMAPLIDLFLIEKAAHEVGYEAANRPGWIGGPAGGLAHPLGRL